MNRSNTAHHQFGSPVGAPPRPVVPGLEIMSRADALAFTGTLEDEAAAELHLAETLEDMAVSVRASALKKAQRAGLWRSELDAMERVS